MPQGREIRLADIWPSDAEIDAVVEQAVKPQQFRNVYDVMFARQESGEEAVSPLYDWRR
jgi:aconitase A